MLNLIFLSLLAVSVTVSGSKHHHLPVLARNVPAPKAVRNLMARQNCSPGDVPCGSRCMPTGAVCCEETSSYCDAGEFCWVGGKFCCLPGYVECGEGCMPPGSACCNAGGDSCRAGTYCIPGACCSIGQTCEGSTTYLAGATLTGPTGSTSIPTPTTTPPSTQSTTSGASTSVLPPASTTSSSTAPSSTAPSTTTSLVVTFTGGAAMTAGPAGPDLYAAVAFIAGQILL